MRVVRVEGFDVGRQQSVERLQLHVGPLHTWQQV